MKTNFRFFAILVVTLLMMVISGCTRVPVGYEAIRVKDFGTYRGVNELALVTGKVWFNPVTETVHKFPVFLKSYPYTEDKRQGSEDDEAIRFSDNQGLTFTADVGIMYRVVTGTSPHVFWYFRKSVDDLTDGYIREQLQNCFVSHGSKMSSQQILGPERNTLLTEVTNEMNNRVGWIESEVVDKNGEREKRRVQVFEFLTISFLSNPRPPAEVMTSINAVIEANNKRLAQLTNARADSQASVIIATGQAEANRLLRASLTNEIIRYEQAKNWRPLVLGGAAIIDLGK